MVSRGRALPALPPQEAAAYSDGKAAEEEARLKEQTELLEVEKKARAHGIMALFGALPASAVLFSLSTGADVSPRRSSVGRGSAEARGGDGGAGGAAARGPRAAAEGDGAPAEPHQGVRQRHGRQPHQARRQAHPRAPTRASALPPTALPRRSFPPALRARQQHPRPLLLPAGAQRADVRRARVPGGADARARGQQRAHLRRNQGAGARAYAPRLARTRRTNVCFCFVRDVYAPGTPRAPPAGGSWRWSWRRRSGWR